MDHTPPGGGRAYAWRVHTPFKRVHRSDFISPISPGRKPTIHECFKNLQDFHMKAHKSGGGIIFGRLGGFIGLGRGVHTASRRRLTSTTSCSSWCHIRRPIVSLSSCSTFSIMHQPLSHSKKCFRFLSFLYLVVFPVSKMHGRY